MWGYSSVGRAPALQAGGHEFESHYLHHSGQEAAMYLENCITKQLTKHRKEIEIFKKEG
jgi:hypothetical protein